MLSDLNVDQWVMVRDRHRLNRLRKGKDSNEAQYQELFEKSNCKVRDRLSRLPNIRLNQDLPVTQSAPRSCLKKLALSHLVRFFRYQ